MANPSLERTHDARPRGIGRSAVAVVMALVAALATVLVAARPAAAADPTARFVPLTPARILDTRTGVGGSRLGAGGQLTLAVAGQGGVPASGAVAVAFNLTAVDSAAAGYFTASPSGQARPVVSNLNVTARGQTVANLVVVRLGTNGAVDLFSQTGGDLVVDVAGFWVASGAATSGRFVPTKPSRILDTRTGNGATGALGAGASIDLQVTGRGGVPASGASSVVLNVTATEAAAAGFVSAWPTGQARPLASVVNLPARSATVPNVVVVPLGAGGKVSLFSQSGTHLVADVAGWFTGDGAPSGTDGLFVPLTPARILDTRPNAVVGVNQSRLLPVGGNGGVPASAVGAVVLNLTGTEARAAGYVTVYPAQTNLPLASNLNLPAAGATVANAAFATLGQGEAVRLYSQQGTHLVVDVAGYFLGTPVPAEVEAVVTRSRPASPESFACNEVNGVGQERVSVNPGLADHLRTAVTPTLTRQQYRDMTYTVAYYSGPFPAIVASFADWDTWVDEDWNVNQGAITVADVFDSVAKAYHEVIHHMQNRNLFGAGVNCLPMAPAGGHRWTYAGYPQSETRADVDQRIDALVTDAFLRAAAHDVATTYLSNAQVPGIADQGFESQLWEMNAYALEMELENVLGAALAAGGLPTADRPNVYVVSAKMHQLARYLYRAQLLAPANFSGLQTAYHQAVVADIWNIAAANWRPGTGTPTALARQTWTLAFGADAATMTAFAPGAIVAPPPQP
jgi:hypothetical protein